jgi:hypothetical protein
MNRFFRHLPLLLVLCAGLGLLLYGPIAQPERYNEFADRRALFGVPNGADVLSSAGFAIVGLWGLARLWPARMHRALSTAWPGYCLFLFALVLVAAGSAFYHLAPDNGRLVWDRLPIALACAGLLAGVRADSRPDTSRRLAAVLLAIAAFASVIWWRLTDIAGAGDLRPYLLVQASPLLVIPVWHAIYGAPRGERLAFGAAILLYIAAKIAELNDHALFSALERMSGHTVKHLLAASASAAITFQLIRRLRPGTAGSAPNIPDRRPPLTAN